MLSQNSGSMVSRVRIVALLALVGLMACGLSAQSSSVALPQVASGTWAAAGQMAQVRNGAASAVLYDGSLLVAGGTDASGNVLATVEIYGADGSFQAAPPMRVARTGHTATWLLSGYVLVAGGATQGGAIVNSAEIYDPVARQWTLLPGMIDARTGHTATVLPNGDVLVAGGWNSSGPLAGLEAFRTATQKFLSAGTLATARQAQAAALSGGRVLIVGGTDAKGATLASTEIYDPVSGAVTAGPALTTPRASATATTLLDGTVLIAAGSYPEGAVANNGIAELQTAEIFDPVAATITALAPKLKNARSGQLAFLLPNNNNVLLDGGVFDGADIAQAELYTPWTRTFSLTGAMAAARSQAVGGALYPLADGLLLVAGGSDLASAELYGFPTVKTDQGDYAPGTPVNISGAGWQPGETVSLYLRESPVVDSPPAISVSADGSGKISNSTFAPSSNDLGVHFYLTAVGAQSQAQAQTMFADGLPPFVSIDCEPDPVAINSPSLCTVSVVGNGTCVPADGTMITWSSTGNLSASSCTLSGLACAVSYTPTGTSESVSATYPDTTGCLSQKATVQPGLQAALSISCPNVTFDGTAHTCTGLATGLGGVAVSGTWSFNPASEINAGVYAVTGTFTSNDPDYVSGGTASATLKINAATPVLNLVCTAVTYDGNSHSCAGTATGVGGGAVNGAWSFTDLGTNAGCYAETGTFTSSDPNYVSGGRAGGRLMIKKAAPVITVTCGTFTYDGTAHSCTATAAGVGGVTVAGSFTFSPPGVTNAGYTEVVAIFTSSDPNYSSANGYGGISINPAVMFSPWGLNFGSQLVGTTSVAQYATFTNTGTAPATVNGVSVSGANPTDYLITDYSGTCTTTMLLAPGKKCILRVNFVPQAVGPSSASLMINSTASAFYAMTLQGVGVPAAPQLTYSPSSLVFGGQLTGTSSVARYVLVASTGTAPLSVTNVTVGGPNASEFAVSNQAGTCVGGATLAYNAKCNLRVVFTPAGLGSRTATLYINDNVPGSPQQVTLSGTGQAPAPIVSLSTTSLTFAPRTVGTSSVAQYVDIRDTGTEPLTVLGVSLVSGDTADFLITNQYGTCTTGMVLQPGQECDIRVVFDPSAPCVRGASLLVSTAAPALSYTVALTGTGLKPASQLTLSTTSLTFPSQAVGKSSVAQYILLTSSGTAPVTISGVTSAGAASGDYKVTNQAGTCVGGATLAPGAKCNLRVVFDPTTTGDRGASVVITGNTGSQTVLVDGTGH